MIDVSPISSITEFERFRFMRGENGELAEISSANRSERVFLVLDCQRFRIARLHIFEGESAGESATPERFKREMRALGALKYPGLSPVFSFGQDDTDLYYASSVTDGESLSDYVRRTGPIPADIALQLALQLVEMLGCRSVIPRALENFSPGDLFLETNEDDTLDLVFTDYSGWCRDDVSNPSELVERVALMLYSLLAGEFFETAPFILFNEEAQDTPEPVKELLKAALNKKREAAPIKNINELERAIGETLKLLGDASEIDPPKRFLRDWLLQGENSVTLGAEYRLLPGNRRNGSAADAPMADYAFDAEPTTTVSYNGVRFQLFPCENSIPREGWLDQHRCAIRHPGRGRSNQLRVTALIPHGRCLLIGEERIDSLSLAEVVERHGPLEIRHALELGNKLNSALDSIEKTVGASPIWWLPPENTHIVTGSGGIAALREALNRYGTRAWHHLPFRLQLHQTIPSLLKGVDLPESLLRRMRTGQKNGDAARRSAILLPLLGFAITGRPFQWEEPLKPVAGIPDEIIDLLEKTRKTLVADPTAENGRLLDRIASTLAGEPIPAFLFAELESPQPSENIIVDSSLSNYETANFDFQRPRARKEGVNTTVAGLMDRSGKDLREFESPPREENSELIGSPAPGPEDDEATQPIPVDFVDTPEIESLGLIEDESVREFATESDSEDALESEDSPESGFPFGPATPDSSPPPTPDGFGERLLAKSTNTHPDSDSEPETKPIKPSESSWSKVISIAIFIFGAILGIAWMIGELSSWAGRQALSEETFQSTRYPGMKTTRPGDPVTPATVKSDSAAPAAVTLAEVADANEATRLASESLESKRYPDALSYYLRALDLQPDSPEVRAQLRKTIEAWSQSEERPFAANRAPPTLDPQKESASQAAWLLAEYHRPRDPAMHLHWLTRSANSGYASHQRELGLILSQVPDEMEVAAEWFHKAADQGDAEAQFHYGECLVFGKGVPKNVNLAINTYLSGAVAAGDGRAMELLGVCYAKGDGVNADPVRAHDYFRKAVEAGNVEAHYNLAVRYAKGDGVSKSETEAARIFHEGAERGDAACMYAYGRCLEAGFGVTRSTTAAAEWIRKSALLDFDEARAWCGLNGILLAKKTAG